MSRMIDLIGVPSDFGAQNGTSDGPEKLRSPLLSALTEAGIFAVYDNAKDYAAFPSAILGRRKPRGKVHYQKKVAKVADIVAHRTLASLYHGHLPVVLGGDHSITMGSGRGALEFAAAQGKKMGLVWIDAHYDAHTHETTHSHHANGMPLATLLGHGPHAFRRSRHAFAPQEVIHLGAGMADCEPEEKTLLQRLGVRTFSAETLRENPIPAWIAIIALVDRVDLIWVSLDLDVFNRKFAPGVHLRNDTGLEPALPLWLASNMQIGAKLCGIDIMEYKPSAEECNEGGQGKTAILAKDFLLRLLGE